MTHLLRVLGLVVVATALLPACSTVKGWFFDGAGGVAESEADGVEVNRPGRPREPRAAASKRDADDATGRAARNLREVEIRAELRRIESDVKAGRTSVPDAHRRSEVLRAELEEVARTAATAGGRAKGPDAAALLRRVTELDARVEALEQEVAALKAELERMAEGAGPTER